MKQNDFKKGGSIILPLTALLSLQLITSEMKAQRPAAATEAQKTNRAKPANYFLKTDDAKFAGRLALVAILKGEPVFRNAKNELFTMSLTTGDLRAVNKIDYDKMQYGDKMGEGKNKIVPATNANGKKELSRAITWKFKDRGDDFKILGVDTDGHVVMQTKKGEKFYLDPATGDMVDWDGHISRNNGN